VKADWLKADWAKVQWAMAKWVTQSVALVFLLIALGSTAWAAEQLTKEELAAKLPGVEARDISESPLEGIYLITLGSNVAYLTADGRYLLQGELYDLETSENLTEKTRSAARIGILADVERDEMIVFSPRNGEVRHTVTIFTDIDCGYCRQFHRDIDKVTELGIEVHYLFYPRTGPATDSWSKADNVWCADNRNDALTQAKLGVRLPDVSCGETPVQEHFELGQRVGVRGTPAVYTASGELIGGYLTPAQLAQRLEELDD
jgi:thiol:disulfide interchange protein DsbC